MKETNRKMIDINRPITLTDLTGTDSDLTEPYSKMLLDYGMSFMLDDNYYYVGKPQKTQGWILHISVIPGQLKDLLQRILPFLIECGLPFKLIRNKKFHDSLNLGYLGQSNAGKALTLYPEDDKMAFSLAELILQKSSGLKGSYVPTDFCLGEILYARYGSHNPIIGVDIFGNKERLIYDATGRLIKDICSIPPQTPNWVTNPFLPLIKQIDIPSKKGLLRKKFLPLKILKRDIRGDVFTTLFFSGVFLKKGIIKQGKKNSLIDNNNRDVRDRLLWQLELHKNLKGIIRIPKAYDYFEEEGSSYLVLEYVAKSIDINRACFNLLNDGPWFNVPLDNKNRILNFIEQVVNSISVIHEHGYIHRDITGTNFLVNKYDKVYLIDLELMYSSLQKRPDPPFKTGTEGYMSPEQENFNDPSFKDDVYSIGALMVALLTGMRPKLFIDSDRENLKKKLNFLIGESSLVDLIARCLCKDINFRPSINSIQASLRQYKLDINTSGHPMNNILQKVAIGRNEVLDAIDKGVHALQNKIMLRNGYWFSPYMRDYDLSLNPLGDQAIYTGIYEGICGVSYLLSKMKTIGFESIIDTELIYNAWEYVKVQYNDRLQYMGPGLYNGTAGIAVSMAYARKSGLLDKNYDYQEIIPTCLSKVAYLPDIINGVAGQGLAAIQCFEFYNSDELLEKFCNSLLAMQEEDGSWKIPSNEIGSKPKKINGFGYGIAGIVYFLLEYGSLFNNKAAVEGAIKGLNYLLKVRIQKNNLSEWHNNDREKTIGVWWCHGAPGIALTFIKAFEVLGEQEFRLVAEQALRTHKTEFVNYDLSQCHGLSGLGELYLEAFRVFDSEEWWERASWIATLLTKLKFEREKINYWFAGKTDYPTADFMTGNSGIIHFLVRYCFPKKISFPVIAKELI